MHALGVMKVLRAGPAPLTLVSLGRWASIAAVVGDSSRGCRSSVRRSVNNTVVLTFRTPHELRRTRA
jgi:hypothetical protein